MQIGKNLNNINSINDKRKKDTNNQIANNKTRNNRESISEEVRDVIENR